MEIDRLAPRAAAGDTDALEKALQSIARLLEREVRGWHVPGLDTDDLMSEAWLASFTAIRTFDPLKGAAWPWVKKHVRQALQKAKDQSVRRTSGEIVSEEIAEMHGEWDDHRLSPDAVKAVWPYLTHAEKRGLTAVIGGSRLDDVALAEQVTKQALHKGATAAVRCCRQWEMGAFTRSRRQTSPMDWRLPEILQSIG